MSTTDKLDARMDEKKRFLQETRKAGPLEGRSRREAGMGSNAARALRKVSDEEGTSSFRKRIADDGQVVVYPPSIISSLPVTNFASSETR